MKKFISFCFACCMSVFGMMTHAQDYLQIVSLVSENGTIATFSSAGAADSKKEVEVDAIKSLFYTLFFAGVEGVNDGQPLVCKENLRYTGSFFNASARYQPYLASVEEYTKTQKVGSKYQGTMRVTIRLKQLITDVKKNTHCDEMLAEAPKPKMPKPTIIVVPYRREGENYKKILENDFDRRIAVSAVQKGFETQGIKTIDLQGRIEAMIRRSEYEENSDAADSNDKQLLLSSGADVYVVVDLKKDITTQGARISLIMKAYETASGTVWASEDGWTNRFRTNATDALCSYAVKDNLPAFLQQIEKNYSMPARMVLQISLANSSLNSLRTATCSNGRPFTRFIEYWVEDNAYEGDYHIQGIVDEEMIFDYVMIPREDKNGRKMTATKFADRLEDALREQGIETVNRIEGNTILLTVQ